MADRDLAADELTKLTAGWLNTLAAGAIVTGVLAPLAQIHDPAVAARDGWEFVVSSVLYLLAGSVTHVAGRVLIELRFGS